MLRFGALLLAVAASCAHVEEKERVVQGEVILPVSMCAKNGSAAMSKDAPGHRMICERQEIVGSHYPRCVCRDEADIAAVRQGAQQDFMELQQHKCLTQGDGAGCNR